jgi:protein required for attachment to host cells
MPVISPAVALENYTSRMKQEWIVVASREEVRIFGRKGVGQLELIRDIGNPAGILRTQDLESDKPGRATDNRMRGRHAYSTEESARDRSLRDFYRDVIDIIERGMYEHVFDSITLIAEPRLLGIIRGLLPPGLTKLVRQEIPKDLSYEDPPQILARIEQAM